MANLFLTLTPVIKTRAIKGCEDAWHFVEYIPSAYERGWTENIGRLQGDVCGETKKQMAEVNQWMSRSDMSTDIFSVFKFRNNCTGEVSLDYIEPLVGLTRSPYFCVYGDAHVVSKDYLVVSPTSRRGAKAYLFDLGSSLYNSGAGGASQQWFVDTYNIKWDGIFAWDAMAYSPSEFWTLVPKHLKPIYHFYNIPVSPEPNHPDNALDYILRVARPEDFVLLKIDIDNTPVEEALVDQILASEALLGLIDEFYFEHHVNIGPMNGYWGTGSSDKTLADTYRIFTTMRNKGILAHGWV